jgi:hypothetical protein
MLRAYLGTVAIVVAFNALQCEIALFCQEVGNQ